MISGRLSFFLCQGASSFLKGGWTLPSCPPSKKKSEQRRQFKRWLGEQSSRLANLWHFRWRIQPGMEISKFSFPKTGALASPYTVYRELVTKRFPEKMDESRIGAMIAL
jgi:hypothetical protein